MNNAYYRLQMEASIKFFFLGKKNNKNKHEGRKIRLTEIRHSQESTEK